MPTIDTLRQEADNRSLVRKIRRALALMAPLTVELPTTLFGPDGQLLDFKALGYKPCGLVTPDGYTFGREVSSTGVNALGYSSEIRSDVDTVVRTVGFTGLESGRRHMKELKYGVDLSTVTQDPVTGEIVWDEPELPEFEEFRLLVLGSDGPATEQWIEGRGFGRVKLASSGDEQWSQENPIQHEYSLGIFTDDEIGSPGRHYLGGTGAVKHKALLGFAAPPATTP